jgi:carbamate kinase
VLTHGNGPQIGSSCAIQNSIHEVPPVPMDYAVRSARAIGYMFVRALTTSSAGVTPASLPQ